MTRPSPVRPELSRRTALRHGLYAAGAAVVLAGCGKVGDTFGGLPRPARRKRADNKDQPLLDAARTDQREVLQAATATLSAHASLRPVLAPLIAHHRTHLEALGGSESPASPSATPSPTTQVPASPADALRALQTVEREAALARAADTTRAASGEFAQILASMSAGQAQHVVVLGSAISRLRKSRA